MGGTGFTGLSGSAPIVMVQMVGVITPDTAPLALDGQPASVPSIEESPTFQFVLMLRKTLQFTTGM
jgi:hypothetical protein